MIGKFVNSINMNTIQYQVLHYLPDSVSGEFANLGVVAYDAGERSFSSEFINCTDRIVMFFPGVAGNYLQKLIKQINQQLVELEETWLTNSHMDRALSIESFTAAVLPVDDSSLAFSEIKRALDHSSRAAVNDLFERIVRKWHI